MNPNGKVNKMDYSKRHIRAIEKRLQEYDTVLEGDFVKLKSCRICKTVPVERRNERFSDPDCRKCLFGSPRFNEDFDDTPCGAIVPTTDEAIHGEDCITKGEQRKVYRHLINRLKDNGYTYK